MQCWANALTFVELESHLVELGSAMDQVIAKASSILVAFELEGVAVTP
jgi:hypothetical protein